MNIPGNVLTYVGHATVALELDGTSLLTDPVLRKRLVHLRRQVPLPELPAERVPDAVLISHRHFDHLDLPTLRSLGKSTRIIAGPGTAALLRRRGFARVEELEVGESTRVGGLDITAVPAEHDGGRRPLAGPGQAVGYLISGSKQIYFAGDTSLYPGMDRISPALDVALLPVWGWGHTLGTGHMGPEQAATAVGLLRPKLAIPIHWGTLFPVIAGHWGRDHLTEPPRQFADRVQAGGSGTAVTVLKPGASTSLD